MRVMWALAGFAAAKAVLGLHDFEQRAVERLRSR